MCQPTLIILFQTRLQSSFSWTNVFTLHFSTKHWKCILKEIGVKSNMKIVKIVLTSFKDENSLWNFTKHVLLAEASFNLRSWNLNKMLCNKSNEEKVLDSDEGVCYDYLNTAKCARMDYKFTHIPQTVDYMDSHCHQHLMMTWKPQVVLFRHASGNISR